MKGTLVKWIHDEEPTNLCVVIKEYLTEEVEDLIGKDGEVDDNPLLLIYDFITQEYFYAIEEELHFL
jgi:hypothetical protein|tara:strand:- start:43 stop:243 length:201 start_codon:yes stop_codon:yes gene_type:complete